MTLDDLDDDVFLAYQYRSNQYLALLQQLEPLIQAHKDRDDVLAKELRDIVAFHQRHMR